MVLGLRKGILVQCWNVRLFMRIMRKSKSISKQYIPFQTNNTYKELRWFLVLERQEHHDGPFHLRSINQP